MRGVIILVLNKYDILVVFGNKVLLWKIKVMFVKILKWDLDWDLMSDWDWICKFGNYF